jgi:hypothetical protein
MSLEPLTDDRTVFYGYAGPLLVVLHGSVSRPEGHQGAGARMGSDAYAVRAALDDTDLNRLDERLAVAAPRTGFVSMPVRFLALVTRRGKLEGGQQREFLLATPLYVEDADREGESPDVAVRGTLRSFSAERGWGLVVPDGDEDGVVIDGRTEPADGGREPLASGQRVELGQTYQVSVIVMATSVVQSALADPANHTAWAVTSLPAGSTVKQTLHLTRVSGQGPAGCS